MRNVAFQVGKHIVKAVGVSTAISVGYSHAPVEPNAVSNFVHTQTPFGRGYDYEMGSFTLKAKGDLVSSVLGNKDMVSAVQKHAPDSTIIDLNKLNDIINDSEFKSKIRENTTIVEKTFLGVPLFDTLSTPPLLTNQEGLGISDLTSTEESYNDKDMEEIDLNDRHTEGSITPVAKESPIRRHNSEPLLRKSNKPNIRPRRTR